MQDLLLNSKTGQFFFWGGGAPIHVYSGENDLEPLMSVEVTYIQKLKT